MEIETKIVAFVDILGFSQAIADFDSGKNSEIFGILKDAIHPAAKFMKEHIKFIKGSPFDIWKDCMDVRLFSDCLCAAVPLESKNYDFMGQLIFFYKYLMGYQSVLMQYGFPTRGAITIGSHYADEHMIFSGGLVEAYQLESKEAVYPRIILSNTLVQEIQKHQETNKTALDFMINIGHDGLPFFNHFNYNIMDAALSDQISQKFMDSLGTGTIHETFVEIDERNKKNILNETYKICLELREKTEHDAVRKKYDWMLSFIDNQLDRNNDFLKYSEFY